MLGEEIDDVARPWTFPATAPTRGIGGKCPTREEMVSVANWVSASRPTTISPVDWPTPLFSAEALPPFSCRITRTSDARRIQTFDHVGRAVAASRHRRR